LSITTKPQSVCLRVLILEDEWATRDYLVEMIQRTGLGSVVGAVAGLEEANAFLSSDEGASGVDVVFVDIQLEGSTGSGLTLVRKWSEFEGAPAFVFATATKDYATEAYELGAEDYLLKPFTLERVRRCMTRLVRRRSHRPTTPPRIVARDGRALVFLSPAAVLAFESSERLTLVHTPLSRRGSLDIDLSLASVELSFGSLFVRVHRHWLINPAFIQGVDREQGETILLVGADIDDSKWLRVPVSRDRADQ
jgi:two-component system, LytTR family, response regulator LytT